MDLQLEDKVAIITGSSKGIGYATALQLAREGAKVVLCARGIKQLKAAAKCIQEETGQEVLYVQADVASESDCEKLVETTIAHYKRVDILINNAGTSAAQPFETVTTELWHTDIDLKLMSAIHCAKLVIPYMRKQGGGAIVNVTAVLAKTPPANSLPTTVSRAAGLALTKAMSKDLGNTNIRVNAVCIGLIRSDQIEKKWQQHAEHLSWQEYSHLKGEAIPLGRIGEAQEAANAITFLVSPAASYITGASLNIDGGASGAL